MRFADLLRDKVTVLLGHTSSSVGMKLSVGQHSGCSGVEDMRITSLGGTPASHPARPWVTARSAGSLLFRDRASSGFPGICQVRVTKGSAVHSVNSPTRCG